VADDPNVGIVRLLINDVGLNDKQVFSDVEIGRFLTLEGDSVKRAAAQALDTIATNEVLVQKVIRTQDLQTDGAKTADAIRKQAVELRRQADEFDENDGYFVDIIEADDGYWPPELAEG
jgi:hypothetical protein